MNVRDTSAPILPRSAEEGNGGYGAASTAPFQSFANTGFGVGVGSDDAHRSSRPNNERTRSLFTSMVASPVVKGIGVLSIFALGAAVGSVGSRSQGVGLEIKVRTIKGSGSNDASYHPRRAAVTGS